jgi:iron complex transport system substrate-binding protein
MTATLQRRAAALLAALAICVAAAPAGPALSGARITDARGVEVAFDDVSRIVAVGGSVTEIVYALGEEERLVAVDTTSTYPHEAQQLPNVGYMRALSAEGVLSADPTLVLALDGAGPPEALDVLAGASVPFIVVPGDTSLEGVADKIRFVAEILGVEAKGETLVRAVEADAARLAEITAGIAARKRVLFVLSLRDGSIVAAGRDTSADAMIRLAGAENVLGSVDGFKTVDAEAVIAAAPEVIVMMSRAGHATSEDDLFSIPAIAATPAGAARRLITMDGLYLLGFGPRTPRAALELAEQLNGTDAPGE